MNTLALVQKGSEIALMAKELASQKIIGLDTEFIRESTFFPKVALIQLATREKSWLIDPTVLSEGELAPLFEVLKDGKILKIMHAAFADQECFYWSYGFTVTPVFDTLVGAALCGFGDNVGLSKLLGDLLSVKLPKGRARAKWLMRPLPQELMKYAAEDVLHLVELAEKLTDILKKKGREGWALEESVYEPSDFDVPAEEIAERMGRSSHLSHLTRLILKELVVWREGVARKENLPRQWVLGNEEILSLSKSTPRSVDELRHFRGLKPRTIEKWGNAILDCVNCGQEALDNGAERLHLPKVAEVDPHVCDFVRTFASFLADREEVAQRFLIPTSSIPDLVRSAQEGVESWVKKGLLSPHSAKLAGRAFQELLCGKLGLRMLGGGVHTVELAI